jgi:site-specific recombinase XerD
LRTFFRFCVNEGWLEKNPALNLGTIKVEHKPTGYFPEEEFQRILDATFRYTDSSGRTNQPHSIRLRALLLLMRYSGLRIRDAVTIARARISPAGDCFLYQAKTGTPVYVPLPPIVLEALAEAAPYSPSPLYYFWSGNGLPKTAVADWQRSFQKLFRLADLLEADGAPKRCHPHMLRDTFAVGLLVAGRPLEEVSMLLGHSSVRITEKHYAPWVLERQRKLAEGVRSTWGPNVVSIADRKKNNVG